MAFSREIVMPKTKLEGLQNFVQMIINKIEAGEVRSALMLAVDLHDDLCSRSNPYSECLKGDARYVPSDVASQMAQEAEIKGFQEGKAAARADAKAELMNVLAKA